jgi:hypothetical protein
VRAFNTKFASRREILRHCAFMATGIEWFRKGAIPSRDNNQEIMFYPVLQEFFAVELWDVKPGQRMCY